MGFATKFVKKFSDPRNSLRIADGRWIGESVLGKKAFSNIDLAGQVIGQYDSMYKPKEVQDIPSPITDSAEFTARDQARRLAKKANGRDSTIRTSPAGATLYSAQPKALLGS